MRVVRRTGLQGATFAVGLHVALISWLLAGEVPRPATPVRRPPVRVSLVAGPPRPIERPKPAPAVEPKAPPPAPAPRVPPPVAPRRAAPRTVPRIEAAARPEPAPAPAPSAPPAAPVAAAPRFSVDISATVSSGGVAVPTAPTGRASPLGVPGWAREGAQPGPTRAGGSGGGRATPGPATVEAIEASTAPRVTAQPDPDELRRAYPPQARRDGLEADVRLRILVATDGRVTEVRVVAAAGSGFDEAATRLARGLRFSPGTKDGRPARVWIPWTFRFRLNG